MISSAGTPGDRVVHVTITTDHVAVMDPAMEILERVLLYRRKSHTAGGPLGHQEVEEDVALCEFDLKGRLCFAAGLLPRARRVLQEHGYKVVIDDRRASGTRLRVAERVLDDADEGVKSLLRAIAQNPLGTIEAHTDKDTLGKMLVVAKMFPEAGVVVAVPTKKQAWRLWRELEGHLDDQVGLAASGTHRRGQWLVATFQSVPRDTAKKYDILLLPYGEDSTGVNACDMVAGMHFKRIYAFTRPHRRPDRLAELRLEQMAGEVVHRVQKPRVPVCVLMLPTPVGPAGNYATPLERKKTLYWDNKVRNGHVAGVAKALRALDRAALKKLGLRNRDIRGIKKCDKARLKLLVETPEHARELLSLLPGWRLGTLNNSADADAPQGEEGIPKTPVVMTAVYAARLDFHAEVVIYAAGTAWPLRVKNFPPVEGKNTPPEVFIIDFDDGHQQDAREDTAHRVKEYQRLGMAVRPLQNQPP